MKRIRSFGACFCVVPSTNATKNTGTSTVIRTQQQHTGTALLPEQEATTNGHQSVRGMPASAAHQLVIDAHKNGGLAFTFSGGGFLLPYFAGVVNQLCHMGLLVPGQTHVAGSSAGSLVAACVASQVPVEKMLSSVLAVAADCRVHGVPGRLSALLAAQLKQHLPPDAHTRCTGVAHIGITRIWPTLRSKVITEFRSHEELISALLASCHLPMLSNGNVTTLFRGKRVVDGGITALLPLPPKSMKASHVVKVACLPREHIPHIPMLNKKAALSGLAIAPGMFEPWTHSIHDTLTFALKPGPHSFMTHLVQQGGRDVMAWAEACGVIHHLEPSKAVPAPPLEVPETFEPQAEESAAHLPYDETEAAAAADGGGGGGIDSDSSESQRVSAGGKRVLHSQQSRAAAAMLKDRLGREAAADEDRAAAQEAVHAFQEVAATGKQENGNEQERLSKGRTHAQ